MGGARVGIMQGREGMGRRGCGKGRRWRGDNARKGGAEAREVICERLKNWERTIVCYVRLFSLATTLLVSLSQKAGPYTLWSAVSR